MSRWAGHDLLAAQAVDFQVREEVEALVRETDAILRQAVEVESTRDFQREDIDAGKASGWLVGGDPLARSEWLGEEPTNDDDWTDAQEERAAGYPGAMPDDYQDPGLTEAQLADVAPWEGAYDPPWEGAFGPEDRQAETAEARYAEEHFAGAHPYDDDNSLTF